jgi:hypothetical protein
MAFVVTQTSTSTALCSGTVVSPNVVLTAAHCAVDESTGSPLDPSVFKVVTGAVDWTNSAVRQVSGVSSVIVNPNYDPTTHNYDAALLVLTTQTTAPSIALAGAADVNLEQAGTGAAIAGWGETYAGSPPPYVLQWAETVVQRRSYCNQFAPGYASTLQLCAVDYPYDDTATCFGDSGGPLIGAQAGKAVEIGITSTVPGDCNTVSADFFTAVVPISSWATAQIQAVAPPPPPTPQPLPGAPQLPTMQPTDARSFARQTLAGVFGATFKRAHQYTVHCARRSSSRFRCKVSWWYGPNDYDGQVTVYYLFGSGNTVNWSDHYAISWVNDQCYFHSGHPGSCRFHTKHGSW